MIVSSRESRLRVTRPQLSLHRLLILPPPQAVIRETRLNLCALGVFQSLKQAGLILLKHFCFQTEVSFPKTTKQNYFYRETPLTFYRTASNRCGKVTGIQAIQNEEL